MIDLWNGIPRLVVDDVLINSFALSLIDIAFMEVRGCYERLQYSTLFKISNFHCPTPLEHLSESASSSLAGLGFRSKMARGIFVNRRL
jgi:hypothetical protein